jgi:hypothetical protein
MDEQHGYRIERVIEGDSITEVLSYVQYDKQDLIRRMRSRLEQAVRTGKVNMRESALLMRRYEEGLAAYTYLADDDAVFGTSDGNGQSLPAVQLPQAPGLDGVVLPPTAVHESMPPA